MAHFESESRQGGRRHLDVNRVEGAAGHQVGQGQQEVARATPELDEPHAAVPHRSPMGCQIRRQDLMQHCEKRLHLWLPR